MRSWSHQPLVKMIAGVVIALAVSTVDIGNQPEAAGQVAPIRVELGAHRFGKTRAPEAVVAQAAPGEGRADVGVDCPVEGICAMPTSIDIAANGAVWVTDPVNQRLLAWAPGRPRNPSLRIPLQFTPADLALAPDGTIYATGVRPGVYRGVRLYALDASGRQRWMSALATEDFAFNSHIRIGPDGILFGADPGTGWTPLIDRDGSPLDPAEQLRRAQPAQPLDGGRSLAVTGTVRPGHVAPTTWAVALRGASGAMQRRWQIVAKDDLGLSLEAVPTLVDGDPVIAFDVYRAEGGLMEHVIVRLSATGLADRFALRRGGYRRGLTISEIRVGPDGRVYQLHTDPTGGISVTRYALEGAGSSPSPPPTSSTTLQPTDAPAPTASASPQESVEPTQRPTAMATPPTATHPTATPSPIPSEPEGPPGAGVTIGLGLLAAVVAVGTIFVLRTGRYRH